jgi:type IV secretory pathway protease TraF
MCLKPQEYIPLIVLCMAAQFLLTSNFMLNVSDSSTPPSLYQVRSVQLDKLRTGDLVALRMPVKEVLALPGDRVRFTPEGIYRNGQLIPNTAPEPGIPHCPFSDIAVPRYFFVGDGTLDPDSWGSRYTCFIPQSIIEGTVTHVW